MLLSVEERGTIVVVTVEGRGESVVILSLEERGTNVFVTVEEREVIGVASTTTAAAVVRRKGGVHVVASLTKQQQ